jgi:hypothetical protein
MRHPLIFKRKINDNSNVSIVFIENDTSNGARPLNNQNKNVLSDIPLSYINKFEGNKFTYGVGVFNEYGKIVNISDQNDINRNIKNGDDGKTQKDNTNIGMSGPISSNDMYFDSELKQKINFIGWNPAVWNNPTTTGGKRRTKKNKFSRKYKKRIGKRTKKNHPKKHTCRRCH